MTTQLRIVIFLLAQWPPSCAVQARSSDPSTANNAGSDARKQEHNERALSIKR